MSTTQQRRGELSVLMLIRRLGLGRNPLRRGVDRLESVFLLGALLAALLAIPAAAVLGVTVRDRSEQTAAQRRAGLDRVQARTLDNTATAVPSAPGQIVSRVRVSWVDASGYPQDGQADVVMGTKAGTALTIWLDRTGVLARAPREPTDNAALGVGAGAALLMLAWPMLWGLFRLARLALDRRRAQEWAREWEQVSPRWTRQY